MEPSRTLSVGFVVAYGEASRSFFADTLLAELCQAARDLGHEAKLVHVYYHGRDPSSDADVGRRLEQWLESNAADLVVVDRIFDPAPIRAHVGRDARRRSVLVSRGDSFDPVGGVDWVVGALPGATRTGATRRTPTVPELRAAFEKLVGAIAAGERAPVVGGVASIEGGEIVAGPPLGRAERRGAYRAVVDHDVVALGDAPVATQKTIFGNAGCPFAADPLDNPHYRGVRLPADPARVARLGCAFCAMGGDYEKRPDAEVVASLVEQAAFWTREMPAIDSLVLDDQAPLRYLASLVRAARDAGVRPVRWLFAARPDGFVRDVGRVEDAIAAARETGASIEVYLSGFESFSDAELERYNKGLRSADLVVAIARMRQLATAHPGRFGYADAKGHSLILWSPWTTPEDLGQTAAALREHGARELFHELGKNRLRLYDDLPIRAAAERDGALTAEWEDGDEGEGRRKGYNVEQPWRFLDRRTRVARGLAEGLRVRLGAESELAQLGAVARFAARLDASADVAKTIDATLEGLSALEAALGALLGPERAAGPERGRTTRASTVLFAGACNNGCPACANRDRWLDDAPDMLAMRVDAARAGARPVLFAGREPTIHPSFVDLVARARGDDRRPVGVVTNGRLLSYAAFTRSAVRAGLSGASVKLFAPTASVADSVTRAPGAHEQALAGFRELVAAVVPHLEIRAPLHDATLADMESYASLASSLGANQIRIEGALDAIELDRLHAAADAVRRLAERCARDGVALEASPLSAATRSFDWYPGLPYGVTRG